MKKKHVFHMMRSSAYQEIKTVLTLNQFPERGVGFPEGKRIWFPRRT